MYNETLKEQFISSLQNNEEREQYKFLFNFTESVESEKETDIHDFDLIDIISTMTYAAPKTEDDSLAAIEMLEEYINWSILKGYRKNNVNPLGMISEDWHTQFIK